MKDTIELCYFRLEEDLQNLDISREAVQNIAQIDFNFSDKYKINYAEGVLKIIKNENYIPNFYNLKENGNISNITAIIGKNGSGKTLLLQFILQILFTNDYRNYDFILILRENGTFKIYGQEEMVKKIQIEDQEKYEIISYKKKETAYSICKPVMDKIETIYFSNILNVRNRKIMSSKRNNHFINISLEEVLFKNYGNSNRILNRNFINETYIDERFLYPQNIQEAKNKMTTQNLSYLNENMIFNVEELTMIPKCYNRMGLFESSLDNLRYFRKEIIDKNKKLVGPLYIEPEDTEKQIYEKILDHIINADLKKKVFYTFQFIVIDKFFEELYNKVNINEIIEYIKEKLKNIQDDKPEKMFLEVLNMLEKIEFNELQAVCKNIYKETAIGVYTNELKNLFSKMKEKYMKTMENLKQIIYEEENRVMCHELYSKESNFEKKTILKSFIPIVIIRKQQFGKISKILDKDKNILNMFNFEFKGLSAGEQAMLNIYSSFYEAIREVKTCKNLLIILDEPELYFHPEWQRRFVYSIVEFFNTYYPEHNIQIIFTSNSPYVLSDLKRDNVITLGKQENERTFAGNIVYLLLDKYFMENTIGAFSEEKIKDVIQKIKKNKSDENDIKVIEEIGEDLIRNNIKEMRDRYDKN